MLVEFYVCWTDYLSRCEHCILCHFLLARPLVFKVPVYSMLLQVGSVSSSME